MKSAVAAKNDPNRKMKSAAATKFSLTQQQTDAVEGSFLTGTFIRSFRARIFIFRATHYCCGETVVELTDEETVCCGKGLKGEGKSD